MYMIKWNNRPELSRIFSDIYRDREESECNCCSPATNIIEKDSAFEIDVAAPGLNKNDLKINVEKDILKISYENGKENETDYVLREFNKHSFCRSFTLPESIDKEKIDAKYHNGVLNVILPKKKEAKPVKKDIKVS